MDHNGRRDPERPEDSGEESNRANQLSHRVTNFYIDNILRPDFGRRRKNGTLTQDGDLLLREQLTGSRASKPANPRQGGAGGSGREQEEQGQEEDSGASDDQHPDTDRDTGESVKSRGSSPARPGSAKQMLWPAWVYCTRYSDRPSSGPRSRKPKKARTPPTKEDKRPRTAFTAEQLQRLKTEFQNNRYLTEQRRQSLAAELGLNESQIKIWFQNKRAKIKKATGNKNSLALHLMAQGLYNHTTAKDKSDSE